jgi:hypothetical protein
MNAKKWMVIAGVVTITLVVATIIMVPLAMANGPINRGFQQYMLEDNTGAGLQMGQGSQWGQMRNGAGRFGNGIDPLETTSPLARGQGQGFVDENGDGVCDNYASGGRGLGFTDTDNDGVCDNAVNGGRDQRQGFVDQDGDGVCDNCGNGSGRGFIDEDGDGVCDHFGESDQQWHGPRHSNQARGMGQGSMGRWAGSQ